MLAPLSGGKRVETTSCPPSYVLRTLEIPLIDLVDI